MSPAELHADSIVIDGLIIAKWNRELFEDMRKGGLTAANCTVSVWEGFQATVNNIVASNNLIRDNSDLVMPVRTTADIRKAKEQGKTGILYGFQNAHAFEDQIGYVEVFKQLGVGIVQMCYNTQNLIGTGCYERDGGLSGFGREIVAEMNRVGIMCDLSHVGSKTSEEVILESKKPVCYSHCLPSGLKEHPRNKSDEELKFIADHGGFVGVTMFAPFLAKGIDSTIDDYAEAIEYVMNRLHPGPRPGLLRVPDPRQGLRPPPDQLRQDRQPAGHPHRGRIPQPHRDPAQTRHARARGAQGDGRELGARAERRLGRISAPLANEYDP
jgi:membrane dipeptidase